MTERDLSFHYEAEASNGGVTGFAGLPVPTQMFGAQGRYKAVRDGDQSPGAGR